MTRFVIPAEFAAECYKILTKRRVESERDMKSGRLANCIVSLQVMEYLVTEMFKASFATEEGRPVWVKIRLNEWENYSCESLFTKVLLLQDFVHFSAEELVRISPAATNSMQDLLVWVDGPTVSINGFVLRDSNKYHYGNMLLGGDIALETLGPGCIRFTYEERITLELNAGNIITYSSFFSCSPFCGRLVKKIDAVIGKYERDSLATSGALELLRMNIDLVRINVIATFNSMVNRVRALKHGGAFLFGVTEGAAGVSIKYRTGVVEVVDLVLCDMIDEFVRKREGVAGIGTLSKLWGGGHVREIISAIVGMSSVDGAVAFSNEFSLLGFGAKVSVRQDCPTEIAHLCNRQGQPCEDVVDVRKLGMRNQSAFQYVSESDKREAFVISMDGAVRYFFNYAGKIAMKDDFDVSAKPTASSISLSGDS